MLKISGLQKSYKGHHVLRGLNMNLEKGDVYGFIGQNGCGKTTTMNIICNIIRKDRGEIIYDEDRVRIGYLPESPALYGYMNGFEYLDFIASCCEYEGDVRARTAEVLQVTRMYNDAHRLIKGYSRGMNQRIGIAAALYAQPDLLILDEPTSALDPDGRVEVMDIINNLTDTGTTIILCTHILGDVERVANKVGIMSGGIMALEGLLTEIKEKYSVANAVTIRPQDGEKTLKAIEGLDFIGKTEVEPYGDITCYAKDGTTEGELFYKLVTALGNARLIPEGVWFRRMSLEQIYLGICNGYLTTDTQRAYSTLYSSGTEVQQ